MCTDNQSRIIPFNKEKVWHAEWSPIFDKNDQERKFILYKSNGSTLNVKKGDWVKIPGCSDKCIIDSINNNIDNLTGPLGITYLPWNYFEQRFADISWNIKGNKRFIICYPCGQRHYGRHIDWDKFELCEAPDNINLDLVKDVLNN